MKIAAYCRVLTELDRMDYAYKSEIYKLQKGNKLLNKTIDKFKVTVSRFIRWICRRFELPSEDEVIREFERETRNFLDAEKQMEIEEKRDNKELEM